MASGSELCLEQVVTTLTQELANTTSINASLLTPYVDSNNIDTLVELEMQRIRCHTLHSEQQYVEQMLLENPITVERRPIARQDQQQLQELKQQRAEACRRSRFNNKVKKAKSKHRHNFISNKLIQTTGMTKNIQDLIKKAECHLLNQGMPIHRLQFARNIYGIDSALNHVQELEDIMPGEF